MTRIYDINALDSIIGLFVDVDSPEGFFQMCAIEAVKSNGEFEISTEENTIETLKLSECKVFLHH